MITLKINELILTSHCGVVAVTVGHAVLKFFGSMAIRSLTWSFRVVTDAKTEARWFNVPVTVEKHGTKDRLGTHVQNPVEDRLRIWMEDVTAFAESPSHRVEEPQKDSPNAACNENPVDVVAKSGSVFAGSPSDGVGNPQKRNATEGKVAPFVA